MPKIVCCPKFCFLEIELWRKKKEINSIVASYAVTFWARHAIYRSHEPKEHQA